MKTMFRSVLSLLMLLVVFVAFAPAEASADPPGKTIENLFDISVDAISYEISTQLDVIKLTASVAEPSVNPYAMKRYSLKDQVYLSDLKHYESPILTEEKYRQKQKLIE